MEASEMNADIELDLTGLESPMPMLKTKDCLDQMMVGQRLLVKTSAAGSENNIRNLLDNLPATLCALNKSNGIFYFFIEKTH